MENDASSPFKGIRIIECGQGVSAAFGAKLLADLGADVIKVEPPEGDLTRRRGPFRPGQDVTALGAQMRRPTAQRSGRGDPEKSGSFIYLNTNKRGVVINLSSEKFMTTLHPYRVADSACVAWPQPRLQPEAAG